MKIVRFTYSLEGMIMNDSDSSSHSFSICLPYDVNEIVSNWMKYNNKSYDDVYKSMNERLRLRWKDMMLTAGYDNMDVYNEYSIRFTFGKSGIENLTVPGNSCGLDIDSSGNRLISHNVDSLRQKMLLIVVYSDLMSIVNYIKE